jgi:nucleotide-binding universal stress UspA family protein
MPIGFDGSPGAEIALRQSMLLAKQLSSDIHVIWIDERHDRGREKGKKETGSEATEQYFKDQVLPEINTTASAIGVDFHCSFKTGNAAQLLISEADVGNFRIVALGHRGSSGIWGRLLGGVADRVSDQAHCDVLTSKNFQVAPQR